MADFTSDWFSPNIPAWRHFFRSIGWSAERPRTVIEIGCYEGRASVWILENLLPSPADTLHCIDVFTDRERDDSYHARWVRNVAEATSPARVEAHATTSFDFLCRYAAKGEKADFVYVDGSHRAADVLEDLILAFRVVRPGGLVICDDYLGGAGRGNDLTLGSPKIAVDAFTTIFRDRLRILSGQPLYQLAFVKTKDRDDDDPTSRGDTAVPSGA